MARKLTPEDFIQRCRTNKFHEFTRQDINEICEHFNQIYQLSQVSKHGKYEVFEFPLFIQHLGDQDFMAAGKVLNGALREYELVLKMSGNETRATEELQKTNTRKPVQTRGTARSSEHNNTTGSTVNSKPPFPRASEKQQSPSDQYQTSQHRHDPVLSTLRITTKIPNHEKPTPIQPRDNDNSQKYTDSSMCHHGKFRDTNQHTEKNDVTDRTKQGARKGYAVGEEVKIPVDIYRRSLKASIMLHDNNPNISDLSDPNRPTKLTERFSELYSNEYTDLYEELEKDRYSERDIVYQLLRVVRSVYKHCQNWNLEIEKQLRKEKKKDTDSEHDKILDRGKQQEEKKLLVKLKKDRVVQTCMQDVIPAIRPEKMTVKTISRYMHYAKQCVEIIWLMCVQNPPMSLEWLQDRPMDQPPTLQFDSNCYRNYTKSGQYVDFCVWPLVRLDKDGPVLSKGIAQGMNK